MGQQMSHRIVDEESMVILDIVADLVNLGHTRLNEESTPVTGMYSGRGLVQDMMKMLTEIHGGIGMRDLESHARLLFPISLATLFQADTDLDGLFHRRDVAKMIHRWQKALLHAKKTYAQLSVESKNALHRAVSELARDGATGLLTVFTVRRVMSAVNSRSVWNPDTGIKWEANAEPEEPVEDTAERRSLAVCTLAVEHILDDDAAKVASFLEEHKIRFGNWLWRVLTAQPGGRSLDRVTEKELSALLVILYEDCVDVDQLAFASEDRVVAADKCSALAALQLNGNAFRHTAANLIALYSKSGSGGLNKEDFLLVADLVAKNYLYRGADLKAVGRYELKSGIGSGANGVVRLGRDVYTGGRVAVKTFNRHDPGGSMATESVMSYNMGVEQTLRIYEEVQPHPHITRLLDVIVTEKRIHFIYQFCGGGSLFDLLTYRRLELGGERGTTAGMDSPVTSPHRSPRYSIEDNARAHTARKAADSHDGGHGARGARGSVDREERRSTEWTSRVRETLRVHTHRNRAAGGLGSLGTPACVAGLDCEQHTGSLASEDEARMVIRALARALAHLHKRGICHRDVRLRNLLYNAAKKAVELADFDTARKVAPGWDIFDGEVVVGSLYYLSPEQANRQAYSGFGADMWCVGVCLYWLLKGRPPFEGTTIEQMRKAMENRDYEPIEGISDSAQALVKSLLSRDPSKRPSAEEVLENRWFAESDSVSLQDLMINYMYESPVELGGIRQLPLAAKLMESILNDAGAHRVSKAHKGDWTVYCTLPEHDIKFTIKVSVQGTHGVLNYQMIRGQGLTFVKASRRISRLWSSRLNGLLERSSRRDSADLERVLDADVQRCKLEASKKARICQLRLPMIASALSINRRKSLPQGNRMDRAVTST